MAAIDWHNEWGRRNNELLQQILKIVTQEASDIRAIKNAVIPRPVKSLAVRFDKPTKQS